VEARDTPRTDENRLPRGAVRGMLLHQPLRTAPSTACPLPGQAALSRAEESPRSGCGGLGARAARSPLSPSP
jgi:hypothetical protein